MAVCVTDFSLKALLLHPGTQYSHRLALQLERVGCLSKFITGMAFPSDSKWLKILPPSVRSRIENRILDQSIPSAKLKSMPMAELVSLYELNRGGDMETSLRKRNKTFQLNVADEDIASAEAIIGFDTSSWILEKRAARFARPYFLDQSIAHPREKELVYSSLRILYPEWAENIPVKSEAHLKAEETEYELAHRIVVASTFTKNSLVKHGIAFDKISVNPYGVSPEFFKPRAEQGLERKLRFVYLGLLGARKGLPFLLDVWKKKEFHRVAELWLAGPASPIALKAVEREAGVFYKGRIPLKDIPDLLNQCDCLVFPSFFEGFGQVILESMAAGLPVIATDATGGPDIIEHGKDGFIIKAGDDKSLSYLMNQFVEHRSMAHEMGQRAVVKAKAFSWDAYGDRWKDILNENK